MPVETEAAVNWALTQSVYYPSFDVTVQVTRDTAQELVDKVREYFNTNKITYDTFSYEELKPYL